MHTSHPRRAKNPEKYFARKRLMLPPYMEILHPVVNQRFIDVVMHELRYYNISLA